MNHFLTASIIFFGVSQISFGQQGILSEALDHLEFENEISLPPVTRGGIENNYSLRNFLPPIGNQSSIPSCVGWATVYHGMNIKKNIEEGRTRDISNLYLENCNEEIKSSLLSPWWVYNKYQTIHFNQECKSGCWIHEVLDLLVEYGTPTFGEYEQNFCAIENSTIKYSNRLHAWQKLPINKNQFKNALLQNEPVIIGVDILASWTEHSLKEKYLDENGVFDLARFYNQKFKNGGHAMCIIGFNDTLSGGAFEIVNSWGEWGEEGICYLKYSDVNQFISRAYIMIDNENFLRKKNNDFQCDFLKIENKYVDPLFLSIAYETENGLNSRGWIRINSGKISNIDIRDRKSNEVFISILDKHGNPYKLNGIVKNLLVDTTKAFEFNNVLNDENIDWQTLMDFKPLILNEESEINNFALFLSENEDGLLANFVPFNKSSLVQSNLGWDGIIDLIDPYSGEVIIDHKNLLKKYTIFYKNSSGENVSANLKINEIKKLNEIKFISKNNLMNYYSDVLTNE